MSQVVIDDSDPRFTYKDNGWSVIQNANAYGGSFHAGSTAGIVMTFGPFQALTISVTGILGPNPPPVHYDVDGNQDVDSTAAASTNLVFGKVLWTSSQLNPSQNHTLNINILNTGTFRIDAVTLLLARTGTDAETGIPLTSSSSSLSITHETILSTSSSPSPPLKTSSPIISIPTLLSSLSPSETSFTIQPSITSFLPIPVATPSPSLPSSSTSPISSSTSSSGGDSVSKVTPLPSPSPSNPSSSGSGGMKTSQVVGASMGAIIGVAIIVLISWLCKRKRSQRDIYRTSQPSLSCNTLSSFLRQPLSLFSPEGDSHSLMLPRYSGSESETDLVPMHSSNTSDSSHPLPSIPQTDPTEHTEQDIVDISQRPNSGWSITTRGTVGSSRCHSNPFLSTFIPPPDLPPLPSLPSIPSSTIDAISPISIPSSMSSSSRHRVQDSISKVKSDLEEEEKSSEITVHQDAGIRLAGPRRSPLPTEELPPPYQTYHDRLVISSSSTFI